MYFTQIVFFNSQGKLALDLSRGDKSTITKKGRMPSFYGGKKMKKILLLGFFIVGLSGFKAFSLELESVFSNNKASKTFKCGNGTTYTVPGEGNYIDYASYWVGVALEDGAKKFCVLCCNEFDDVVNSCVFGSRESARDYALVHCKSQGTQI
jgi:hypothetical protein